MNIRMQGVKLALGALVLGGWLAAFGQSPVISSLAQNGALICTNLAPGSVAVVEWASSVTGPWTNNWAGLDAVTVDSQGMIQVSVPMFYRVRGFAQGTSVAPTNMVEIPAGSFMMGDVLFEGRSDELPLHEVYVSAIYMDKYEVTKTLWHEVYLWAITHGYSFDNPGSWTGGVNYSKGPDHPVHWINWYDMVKWCNARSEKENRRPAYYTGVDQATVYRSGQVNVQNDWVKWNVGYRLPTEAEWEKAARGGSSGHRFPWSNLEMIAHSLANYNAWYAFPYDLSSNADYHPAFTGGGMPYTSPVGYFAANGYGLYDMAGNVFEWCWDWDSAYSSGSQADPRGPVLGNYRVARGGSWFDHSFHCRTATRATVWAPTYKESYVGFRCVLPPGQ